MGSSATLLLLLVVAFSDLTVWVEAEDPTPTRYPYDCRRNNVGCLNDGDCNIPDGVCDCTDTGFEGHDCGLDPDTILLDDSGANKCETDQCKNDAVCLKENACYCNEDTYGTKCENPRIKMWCTDSQMFINIYPHGSAFNGELYLRKTDGNGKGDDNCELTAVDTANSIPNVGDYIYVKTVQKQIPTLAGFFMVKDHVPAEAATDACEAATKINETSQTVYKRQLMLEYNQAILSSVDQIITLNCTISSAADAVTTENAAAVTISEDDYKPVNETTIIEPVLFEVIDPETNTVITNSINLGDPLDLTFTLQVPTEQTGSTITQFKVTGCLATNGQSADQDGDLPPQIEFLINECGSPGSEMLFRNYPIQSSDGGVQKTVIPLNAFRFVGDSDTVAFTCTLKLCTADTIDTDPQACEAAVCSADDTDEGEDNEDGEDTEDGDTEGEETAGEETAGEETAGEETAGEETAGEDTAGDARRRKRRSADEKPEKVTKSIQVTSPRGSKTGQTGTDEGPEKEEEETEDCMQHSEVVIIIVIFAVILCILVLSLVIVVINLLRSRQKVVDASDQSAATAPSHYTLPRLSLTTTM